MNIDNIEKSFLIFFNRCKCVIRVLGYVQITILVMLSVIFVVEVFTPKGPNTVYKHFNIVPGPNEGLKTDGMRGFILNGKPLTITAGIVHHYRVHPKYWRDSMKKLRAAGAIAIKTTIPWNLHEPYKDVYDFGGGNTDISQFLDIIKFIQIAKKEDLLVILSIGPFINADMDFGGLPSYLVSEGARVRTADAKFMERVQNFFGHLLPLLEPLQIQNGGPIIMLQLENAYGAINADEIDAQYLIHLKEIVDGYNMKCLLFTSDPVSATLGRGSLTERGVLQTVNSETDVLSQMEILRALNPSSPVFVHFRTGVVDHWTQSFHNTWPTHEYVEGLQEVLQFNASVCVHVFHGGTTFGFQNGATTGEGPDSYYPHTTSYDCDAPLTEAGDYSSKYGATLEMFRAVHPSLHHPDPPKMRARTLNIAVRVSEELPWRQIVSQLSDQLVEVKSFCPMEALPPVQGMKQSFGYVRYSFKFKVTYRNPKLKILGLKRDVVMVLVNGWTVGPKEVLGTKKFGFWDSDDEHIELEVGRGNHTLELLVESWGRVSHTDSLLRFVPKKGLTEDNRVVLFGGASHVSKLNISGMPFLSSWVTSLHGWKDRVHYEYKGAPSLVRATFTLTQEQISDTFLDTTEWGRGVVFVNGFNIGRYFCGGPQHSLYIPAPLLRIGSNSIIIFEHYYTPYVMKLTTEPIYLWS